MSVATIGFSSNEIWPSKIPILSTSIDGSFQVALLKNDHFSKVPKFFSKCRQICSAKCRILSVGRHQICKNGNFPDTLILIFSIPNMSLGIIFFGKSHHGNWAIPKTNLVFSYYLPDEFFKKKYFSIILEKIDYFLSCAIYNVKNNT